LLCRSNKKGKRNAVICSTSWLEQHEKETAKEKHDTSQNKLRLNNLQHTMAWFTELKNLQNSLETASAVFPNSGNR
jgi:hypothetical protein